MSEPDIYAVISQKGGSGKTTISTNLAVEACLAGKRAMIVDTDPQGSSGTWSDIRDKPFPGASERMDRQFDSPGSLLCAQMVVEHEAVDGEDRSWPSPAHGIVGIAAVAEGSGDGFEGIAPQALGPHPPLAGAGGMHGYGDGTGFAFPVLCPAFGPRRRRRSALRCF